MTPALVAAILGAGAGGAVVRWLTARAVVGRPGFPWAVLIVNVLGSAIGGAVLGFAEAGALSADLRLVLLTGLCGGLTTFSTLSVETIQLVLDGHWRTAALSVAGNLALGIGAATAAYLLTR